jgi:hypothetical protein
MRNWKTVSFAVALSGIITLTGQAWIGSETIYSPEFRENRVMMHQAILDNELPDSIRSWRSVGGNGVNTRLLTVWASEGIHRVSGFKVLDSYRILETLGLFACCVFLFLFLSTRSGPHYALIGVLYFGAILPLTYFLHFFHPWDRPSLMFWILALWFIRSRRLSLFLPVLVLGMLVKHDMLFLPVLIFLVEASPANWKKPGLVSLSLLVLTVGLMVGLRLLVSDGADYGFSLARVMDQISGNLDTMRALNLSYPPFLALGLPIALAVYGFSRADRFSRASVLFFCLQGGILFARSNFVEVRAEMPLLMLLLPAALVGLQRVFQEVPSETQTAGA